VTSSRPPSAATRARVLLDEQARALAAAVRAVQALLDPG
jgi:hypothetical protein